MSSKKHKKSANASAKPGQRPQTRGGAQKPAAKAASAGSGKSKMPLILGTVVALAVVIGIVVASSGGGGANGPKATAEELKYLGRLLPSGYAAPEVAKPTVYTQAVAMSDVTATGAGTQITVPVSEVTSKKNVYFEYARPNDKPLPLLAYVKPSGKLFVGISYCPPCEGERQTITPDGALTCDSCGTKRNLETEAGLSGACKLYPLDEVPATVSGGNVVIEKAVLDGWTAQPLDRKVG